MRLLNGFPKLSQGKLFQTSFSATPSRPCAAMPLEQHRRALTIAFHFAQARTRRHGNVVGARG
jgi:hypothetical protein